MAYGVQKGDRVGSWSPNRYERIKPAEGARLTVDEMTEYCRAKIAIFKIPRYWKFVDDFPMTVTGKFQKFRMKEWPSKGWDFSAAAETRTA